MLKMMCKCELRMVSVVTQPFSSQGPEKRELYPVDDLKMVPIVYIIFFHTFVEKNHHKLSDNFGGT